MSGTAFLALAAAVATATAVVLGLLHRTARQERDRWEAQALASKALASAKARALERSESAVREAGRELQRALSVNAAARAESEDAKRKLDALDTPAAVADRWNQVLVDRDDS